MQNLSYLLITKADLYESLFTCGAEQLILASTSGNCPMTALNKISRIRVNGFIKISELHPTVIIRILTHGNSNGLFVSVTYFHQDASCTGFQSGYFH